MSTGTKCPVCFTRMNAIGHDLVCPECGYKYCDRKDAYSYDDHNHNEYRSYNQKTTHTAPRQQTPQKSAVSKVVIAIIIFYITIMVISLLGGVFVGFFSEMFWQYE